jgi:hypothetical protein
MVIIQVQLFCTLKTRETTVFHLVKYDTYPFWCQRPVPLPRWQMRCAQKKKEIDILLSKWVHATMPTIVILTDWGRLCAAEQSNAVQNWKNCVQIKIILFSQSDTQFSRLAYARNVCPSRTTIRQKIIMKLRLKYHSRHWHCCSILFIVFHCYHRGIVVKALCYKLEGRGFGTRWSDFLNLLNPSGCTRPWGLLSL